MGTAMRERLMRHNFLALTIAIYMIGVFSATRAGAQDAAPRVLQIRAPAARFEVMLGNDDASGSVYCVTELSATQGRLTVLPMQTGVSLNGPFSAASRDILFLDEHGRIVVLSRGAPPYITGGGPGKTVSVLARYFIELVPGQASKFNLHVGDNYSSRATSASMGFRRLPAYESYASYC